MIIIPAIDLRGGNVVRLLRGNYEQETTYASDPVQCAAQWVDAGAEMLHIVDLDGAREETSVNMASVKAIVDEIAVPIQLGGGLRSTQEISTVLLHGISRAIIGTKALDQEFLSEIVQMFGSDTVVVGLDAVDGIVQTEGWLKSSGLTVESACEQIIDCGVQHIVFTDISRDGTLAGPNIESLKKVLQFSELNVVASGGIGSIDHICAIKEIDKPNIFGIIIGKALYEGTVDLKEAIAITKS